MSTSLPDSPPRLSISPLSTSNGASRPLTPSPISPLSTYSNRASWPLISSPILPLSTSPNGVSRPLTPSPKHHAKSAPLPRIIRRKPSLRAFHPHLDSSESVPSAHSSLYDASLQTFSLEDAARAWDIPLSDVAGTNSPVRRISLHSSWNSNDENDPSPPNGRTDRIFSAPARNSTLHIPHVLAPITERPSNTTLRPSISSRRRTSLSLPDLHKPLPKSSTRASLQFPIPPRSPHRPFISLDELASLAETLGPSPHVPPRPPPARIPTPPGLPTFNSPAAVSYRLPAPPMRRRDRFRPATPKLLEWRAQTSRLPRGVVMRGDGGVLVRGRFRWGGGGDVDMSRHPWNQATEDGDGDSDGNGNGNGTAGYVNRLRRSAGHGHLGDVATARSGRGCENRVTSRNGPEGNAAVAGTARSDSGAMGQKDGRSFWTRAWERGCWVCCGAEGEEGGEGNLGNVVVMDAVGAEGGHVGRVGRVEGVGGVGGVGGIPGRGR